MSNSLSFKSLSKNLYVRLSALAVTTGLGGVGIYQSLPEGETPVAEAEADQATEAKPAELVMLDDPSTDNHEATADSSDQFRMPPPEEQIVRANNDDPIPSDPSSASSVYSTGAPQPAPIPAYSQPPTEAASAYAQASASEETATEEPPNAETTAEESPAASQPPASQYGGAYQAVDNSATPATETTAEVNPRYQPPVADPTTALPAESTPTQPSPTQAAPPETATAESQPAASPLRMQGTPEVSTNQPPAAAEQPQPTPAPAEPTPYQPQPTYGNNTANAGDSEPVAEATPAAAAPSSQPAALPNETAPVASTPSEPPPTVYHLQESGTPQRPIAVPEGSERYGQLPPEGLDQLAGQGVGTPGDRSLEGPQTPNVRIEKTAPPEIQVGKQARFEIKVMNTGQSTAHQVVVLDELPRGVRFVSSAPPADQAADGALMWQVGALRSGEESTISLEVMPLEEGQIGSVATVSFQAQASVRTRCTRPQLALEHTAPKQVLIGQPVTLAISLSNPGTGAATGVIIEDNVPEGLTHPAGKLLEYEVGTLKPGETRQLELSLTAAKPGIIDHVVMAHGEGSLEVEHRTQIEVIAPKLELAMSGPKKRYLDRQATYTIAATNAGTAAASDVEIVTRLPRGMKFLAADNEGQYDSTSHAVYWSLAELPAESAGQMQVTALPVEVGEQKLRTDGHAALGLESTVESLVDVQALAELFFTVTDAADPIEVSKETVYEIRIVNQGSKVAQNVVATALLPQDLQAITGDGPTRASQEGGRILFAPLPRLAPQEEAVYKIRVQGMRAGDHRITVQVVSDDTSAPVTKEESTRVYSDQ